MTRAERRHRTDSIVKKRLKRIRYKCIPGKLKKWNTSCNCGFCVLGKKKFKRTRFFMEGE